jgi:putative membrane protein
MFRALHVPQGTSIPPSRREPPVLLLAALALLLLSGIRPEDRFTWVLEVAPVVVAVPILVATYRRFPLTTLA